MPATQYQISMEACTIVRCTSMTDRIPVTTQEGQPHKPLNPAAVATETDVTLTWEEPSITNGRVKEYKVLFSNKTFTTEKIVNAIVAKRAVFSNLHPWRQYNYTMSALTSRTLGYGPEAFGKFKTKPAAPLPVFDVKVEVKSGTRAVVSWKSPSVSVSVISTFEVLRQASKTVYVEGVEKFVNDTKTISLPVNAMNAEKESHPFQTVLSGLIPHTDYSITLRAIANSLVGRWSSTVTEKTLVEAPPKLEVPSVTVPPPQDTKVNKNTQLLVRIPKPDNTNGKIQTYAILVYKQCSEKTICYPVCSHILCTLSPLQNAHTKFVDLRQQFLMSEQSKSHRKKWRISGWWQCQMSMQN